MRRLAELQHFTIDSSNDIRISNGESHCWDTLSIQDGCLESKSGETMDPSRRINRQSRRTTKEAIESSKKADRRDEKKENGIEKRRKRQYHEPSDYEPPGKVRKFIAASHSPTTIPSPHILRKDSAGALPYNSTSTFEPVKVPKNKPPATINESANKIGTKSLKVKTTQELIADLLSKQKTSLSVSLNENGIVSVEHSPSTDSKFPEKKSSAIQQHSHHNVIFTPSFKRSRSSSSSKNENIALKSSKVKKTTWPLVQEHFNDGITCSSSPKHEVNTTNIRPDKCLADKTSISGITNAEVVEKRTVTKLRIKNEKARMAQLDSEPHETAPKTSVITTDIPPADTINVKNGDYKPIDSPEMHPSIDSPSGESTEIQQPSTTTSPMGNHNDNPQRQDGIHGNYINGVWYPWQECYDVEVAPDVKMRVLPYVTIY